MTCYPGSLIVRLVKNLIRKSSVGHWGFSVWSHRVLLPWYALPLSQSSADLFLSQSLTHVLYYLVAYPEHIETLREEILQEMDGGDLTYESLDRMRKLDSFIRESQRISGISNGT